MSIASIHHLTVMYGQNRALNDFSVEIPSGAVGLLGPNGAGKTTLLKTLLGFIKPASGGGSILGCDINESPRRIRQLVGLMPEQDCHIPGISAVSFVAYAGELAGMPSEQALRRAHEVLEYCGLGEARYRNVETYSTGMKQRIKLAQALVHGPKLLLLDEPTNGLDPRGREEMLQLVRSISHGKEINVLVSSHILKDIERVCDEVIVVSGGQLRAQGLIKDLKRIEGRPVDVELREDNAAFLDSLAKQGTQVTPVRSLLYRCSAPISHEEMTRRVLQTALSTGAQVRGLASAERSLEDAFLEALGK